MRVQRVMSVFLVVGLAFAWLVPLPVGAVDGTEPVSTVAGGNGTGSASNQLHNPIEIELEVDGSLYVADASNHRVQKFASDGTITTVAGGNGSGPANNQLSYPYALARAADGSLYVADTGNDRVQRIASDGTVTTVAGGNGAGSASNQLDFPTGLELAVDGSLYVADFDNDRVQRVASDGTVTTVAGGNGAGSANNQLDGPMGMALGADGSLYVADYYNDRVQRVASDGTVTTVAGGNGAGSALNQTDGPRGLALSADGSLYVVEQTNHRVQKVASDGTVTIIAGGNGRGSANNQLDWPYGVALDVDGSLYVADTFGERVQKLTAFDTTDPSISITSPAAGSVIDQDSVATFAFSCADTGTSGLATCTATMLDGTVVASGDAIDTASTGPQSLIVTATDVAGNTSSEVSAFTVAATCGPILSAAYQGTSGIDARIARLYAAYYLRDPDSGGFSFWQAKISAGDWTNADAATFFGSSPEFTALYGAGLSNSDFVTLLYENALCRDADAGGLAFWLNRMNNEGWTRGQVALGFSDAPEFRARTMTS